MVAIDDYLPQCRGDRGSSQARLPAFSHPGWVSMVPGQESLGPLLSALPGGKGCNGERRCYPNHPLPGEVAVSANLRPWRRPG